jgi:hypothetical protein
MKNLSLDRRLYYVEKVVWVILIISVILQLPDIVSINLTDFDHYYTAAVRLTQGENIYYEKSADGYRDDVKGWYIYPPYFAALLYPLTFFQRYTAKVIFLNFAFISIILIDLFLVRICRIVFGSSHGNDMIVHFFVFFTFPSMLVLRSLQIESFLFLLILLMVFYSIKESNMIPVSLSYILGGVSKLWTGPYLLSLFFIWPWQFITYCAITLLIGLGLFTCFFGFDLQLYYIQYVLPSLLSYVDPYVDNQSMSRFFLHVLYCDGGLLSVIRYMLLGLYVVFTIAYRKELHQKSAHAIVYNACFFCIISLLCTPTAWTATHIRLLFPLLISLFMTLNNQIHPKWLSILPIGSMIFYIYPQNYTFQIFPGMLHQYPLVFSTLFQFCFYTLLLSIPFRDRFRKKT